MAERTEQVSAIVEASAEELTEWLSEGQRLVLAVANRGLEQAVAQELLQGHGHRSVLLGGRLCFPWPGGAEAPVLHGASRVVQLFWLALAPELQRLRGEEDMYEALARRVEQSARTELPALAGAGPYFFNAKCRVSGRGAERKSFGDGADWTRLKAAVRDGVQRAFPEWTLELRTCHVTVPIVAFVGEDHVALGVEVPEAGVSRGLRFGWTQVPRVGMETQLAGAMAWFAAQALPGEGQGTVVDPMCGKGTLLLAVARACAGSLPRLIGRDADRQQYETCVANFEACGLDARDIEHAFAGLVQSRGSLTSIPDGAADALLCDLPNGAAHKEGAHHDSYNGLLDNASRVLRVGGRCVLLSTRRVMLAKAVQRGPWHLLFAWSVGRGEGNLRESQLLVLERAPDAEGPGPRARAKDAALAAWAEGVFEEGRRRGGRSGGAERYLRRQMLAARPPAS